VNDALTLFVGGSLSYNGERRGAFANAPGAVRFTYPSYTQLDAQAGGRYGTWAVTLFGSNLGDKRGVLGDVPRGGGAYGAYYIQPRTIGLSLSKDF
jgi:hypothetical protein